MWGPQGGLVPLDLGLPLGVHLLFFLLPPVSPPPLQRKHPERVTFPLWHWA